jgi:signal peptidase II
VNRVRTLGVAVAALTLAADQASKLWLLRDFDLARRQPVAVMPGFDLVLAWNRGISYSLLTADTDAGRYVLIAATLAAILLLVGWLYRTETTLTGLALGLLIGGAAGNLVDRFAYGAVVDFVFLHAGSFRWYIFNGADCAIVAGVALLLVEWVVPRSTADAHKSPRSSQHS